MSKKVFKSMDGNEAAAWTSYAFTEVAGIYPITPSTPMAEFVDAWAAAGKKNLFGMPVKVVEMQSEAGAIGMVHGSLLSGALTTTYTASQGLLLMIPNMYKIAGEQLPLVINVASRSLATHALSIMGDHQDIYATRATGFGILVNSSVQEIMDLTSVAHLSAIKGRVPFINSFDGFRTSHELQKVELIDLDKVKELLPKKELEEFRNHGLNINDPATFGTSQMDDVYFQNTEARNKYYDALPDIVENYMNEISTITGRVYKPFNYYGSPNARRVIVAMGSVCETIKETIDKVGKEEKLGLIEVHLYRPFSAKYFLNVLPETVKKIAVLDRTKESGAHEPLYLDVVNIIKESERKIEVLGGRYGLSSKNTTPEQIYGVYKFLDKRDNFNGFTVGIIDDVTNLSIEPVDFGYKSSNHEILIYGFGSDGMVSASKDLMKLINKKMDMFVQGYFEYDSKKSGGVTVSNLRYAESPINEPFYVKSSEITVVTKLNYFDKYEMVDSLKNKGILLINTNKKDEELINSIPNTEIDKLIEKKISVKFIDADKIAEDNNIKGKISKIMEAAILHLLGLNDSLDQLKENVRIQFKTKGENVVNSNINAIDETINNIKDLELKSSTKEFKPEKNIFEIINNRKGNKLKVSDLLPLKDGAIEGDLTKYEKRGTSTQAPVWNKENCIQCGMCSMVCPHAAIRTFIDDKKDGIPVLGKTDKNFTVKISCEDCTSCGACVNVCPGKMNAKALTMQHNVKTEPDVKEYFENYENPMEFDKYTIKGSQLVKPCFEFSGACAGCGETPYVKLLTQVVGKKLFIANATGCSSIYGGSTPSTPYSIPWANSLFEDNAEFALGMKISLNNERKRIEEVMHQSIDIVDPEIKELYETWLNNKEDYDITLKVQQELEDKTIPNELKDLLKYIPANSVWALGGDGWAYDIGYGGLDHILHSNEKIRVLVLDTEVYSNTGGQASKSTNMGAIAEFANMGKRTSKKDLFRIAMGIPNCYVGSISLGANMFQAIKTFKEAEEHDGPSLVIAYCPCIEQGIKAGMGCSINEEKLAVECGYTMLMRYNPDEDKLYVDSKEPNFDKYEEFLDGEVRFNALKIKDKELADKLLTEQKEQAKKRYQFYSEKKQ